MMYRRLRNWFVVGALLILGAGFVRYRMEQGVPVFPAGDGGAAAPAYTDSTVVERGDIEVEVSATGAIIPAERIGLFFAVPGKVAEVLVEDGDRVSRGQVLARLDMEQLELALNDATLALELQQIVFDSLTSEPREEDLALARAAVYVASTQLTAAQADPNPQQEDIARLQYEIALNQLWQSQLQRDSVQEVIDELEELKKEPPVQIAPGVTAPINVPAPPAIRPLEASIVQAEYGAAIAEQQLAQAQNATANNASIAAASAAIVSAQSQLDRLLAGADEQTLAIADAQLQTAYLSIELARHQLEQAQLSAPFDGVVSTVNLVQDENPPTTQPAVEMIDNSVYYIDLAVDEMDIAAIQPGQQVEIVLDALPGEVLTGTVTRADRVATNLGGLITYDVRVTLNPTEVPVRVGMSATAAVMVDQAYDTLRLRSRFIRIDRRTQQAFVTRLLPDGTLEEVEVVLGRQNETYSEIVSGLTEGEQVVLVPRSVFTEFGF